MFRVRKEQFAVFSALAQKRFEAELCAHLREHFVHKCQKLGDAGLVDSVAHAIERGKQYGFVTEQQVCSFANLIVLLGRDFDQDPKLRWVARILNGTSYLYADQKLDALFDEVERRDLGDDDEFGAEEEAKP